MAYSKITKKGQLTVPVSMRKKFQLKPGTRVSFSEKEGDLVIKPLPDIVDSAGSLAQYANAEEVLRSLLREREQPFR